MILETQRLLLRPFAEEDFGDFYAYVSDRELCRLIGWNRIADETSAREVFDGMLGREEYAIVLKETGRVIGNFAALPPHPGVARDPQLVGLNGVSISFAVSAAHQRKGYLTEAMHCMLEHLFCNVGLDYVNGGYFDFNKASETVHAKFGFQPLNVHSFTPQGGKTTTVIERVLFREEYMRQRME